MFSPSTVGRIAAGFLVPVGAAIVIATRKPKALGEVQSYSKSAAAISFLAGIAAIAIGIYLVVTGQGDASAGKQWAAVTIAFVFGIGAMVGSYYYATYAIIVAADSLRVNHPFKGTFTIERNNLVAVKESAFKGARLLDVEFMDGDTMRKITIDLVRFDVDAFFGRR